MMRVLVQIMPSYTAAGWEHEVWVGVFDFDADCMGWSDRRRGPDALALISRVVEAYPGVEISTVGGLAPDLLNQYTAYNDRQREWSRNMTAGW